MNSGGTVLCSVSATALILLDLVHCGLHVLNNMSMYPTSFAVSSIGVGTLRC
jgi:hypothetical protein